ncbi:hypothetical protein [Thalassobacillus sp. CUG 92003]|nr:hypothetical protein [Thalassobacillus sp. CUG 92003]
MQIIRLLSNYFDIKTENLNDKIILWLAAITLVLFQAAILHVL